MPPNQTPDLAPREEDDEDLETVQMGGKELEQLLSSIRPPKEEAADWLAHSGLTRTPSDSLAGQRDDGPPSMPQPAQAPAPAEPVARWPWLLAAAAVMLLLAVAALAIVQ